MTSKYQDRYSMWHNEVCHNGEPSSNNAYIFSAYAKYLAPGTVDQTLLKNRYKTCLETTNPLIVNRKPDFKYPPVSKDEIIGMVSLGLLDHYTLKKNHYNFCNIDKEFDRKFSWMRFFKSIPTFWSIRNKHRDYLAEYELRDTYQLAFKLTPNHIYYVRRMDGKSAGIIPTLHFYLNAIFTYFYGKRYSRMILWLQCEDLKHPLLRFIPKQKWVKTYFGEEHDLYKRSW